jgi:hypothetical protein
MPSTVRVLLLTGGLAAGKTAVAKEVIAIASVRGLHAAAIDLDWLGWATGAAIGVDDLIARNLTAVAGNYAAAGVDHLLLARTLIGPRGLEVVAAALPGWELTVVRLAAPRPALEQRIRARDSGAELQEHLAEIDEMTQRATDAAPLAHVVVNDQRELDDVACEVMRAAGWIND